MGPGDESHIAALSTWYRASGVGGHFELVPGLFDAALARELHKAGYFHSGFQVALMIEPHAAAPVRPRDIDVEPVDNPGQLDAFFAAYVAGWRFERGDRRTFKSNVQEWLGRPGWSLYLARVDGRPRRPRRCSCTTKLATARMPQPIRIFAAVGCMERYWRSGSPMPLAPALISCAAALTFFPRAIAAWSGRACGCSSLERYGPTLFDARALCLCCTSCRSKPRSHPGQLPNGTVTVRTAPRTRTKLLLVVSNSSFLVATLLWIGAAIHVRDLAP